jgi:hypothetical protein
MRLVAVLFTVGASGGVAYAGADEGKALYERSAQDEREAVEDAE